MAATDPALLAEAVELTRAAGDLTLRWFQRRDLDVERNVLTVRADRPMPEATGELLAAERPRGMFSRQLVLGDNLDLEKISANYRDGVLKLSIPVAERAKPRKIAIDVEGDAQTIEADGAAAINR